MILNYCVIYDEPQPISTIGIWSTISGENDKVLGYSFLGDLFLYNSETEQISLLYTMPPELSEMQFFGIESFLNECLTHEIIKEDVLNEDKVDEIVSRVGRLEDGQIYIPEPYPFLGGDLSIDSYTKGDLQTFLLLVGELQLK